MAQTRNILKDSTARRAASGALVGHKAPFRRAGAFVFLG